MEKMRLALSKANWNKLKELLLEREWELSETYHEILGEYPPDGFGRVDMHHMKHRGACGDDKADNLICLSYRFHMLRIHGTSWKDAKDAGDRVKKYLSTEEVKEWNESHREELEKIYATAEETRIRKLRKRYGITSA